MLSFSILDSLLYPFIPVAVLALLCSMNEHAYGTLEPDINKCPYFNVL